MKRFSKRLVALFLAVLMVLPMAVPLSADDFILVDENRTFAGRTYADALMRSAGFDDLMGLDGAWPVEAVVRGVALGALSGDTVQFRDFRPNATLTRQEALNIVMRAIGLSGEAAALGEANLGFGGTFPTAQNMLNTGYQLLAVSRGIIPPGFSMFGNVTRQEVASMLHNAIVDQDSAIFPPDPVPIHIYNFADWRAINPAYLIAIENIAAAGIMNGDGVNFNPTANLTRGEMAQVLANLGDIFLGIHGLERRTGVVVETRDFIQFGDFSREIHIRQVDGSVDTFEYHTGADAVVHYSGTINGLMFLEIDDSIEYFVHIESATVWYVNILGVALEEWVEGQLFSLEDRVITLRFHPTWLRESFSMVDGLISVIDGREYIMMDGARHNVSNLPFGQNVRLYLRDGIIIRMSFVGTPVLVEEIRGLVVENNPAFGYMVVVGADGQRFTMRYYEQEMMVQRLSHWDHDLPPAYIGQLFPTFAFNPLATTIARVTPGDIVFIRPEYGANNVIAAISAISNYIMRYGRINSIVHHEDYMSVLIEQENGQTTWFEVATGTFITREGTRINQNQIMVGDWARFLVNEAVLAPGHMVTSVIEMTIAGDARHITSIVRGNLRGINAIQNTIMLEHSQTLSQAGWTNFNQVGQFNISNPGISFYYNNRPISRTEALRMFNGASADVYLALENHFAGERVAVVSFRTSREERLPSDTVIMTDGGGQIWLSSIEHPIATDSGTIVRRHGRLVSGLDIFPGDYASVVLNGNQMAAVVDITHAPDTSAIQIFRVRIQSVADAQSFTVTSMSQLFGYNWVFTPINRVFTIDTRTIFMPYGHTFDTFRTGVYDGVADEVFTIVADSARAAYVVTHPFANRAVRGVIDHDVTDGQAYLILRDATVQDHEINRWDPISNVNTTIRINLDSSTLVGRNNEIVPLRELQRGDSVIVMTENVEIQESGSVNMGIAYGRIILVN